VTADIYPYIHNGLSLESFIHPRHFRHGRARLVEQLKDAERRAEIRAEMETTDGWENWFRHVGRDWSKVIIGQANDAKYAKHAGQSVAAIAEALDEDPWDTFFALAADGAFALPESMTEANKILAMQQDFVSFCTDVGPAGGSKIATHPRAFGAFPRLLSRYVRELGVLSLERAVAQASAGATNKILAHDRGRIAVGLAADIIVFDPSEIADRATFAAPHEQSVGMRHVLVNGVAVLRNGKLTRARPGVVLRGPGYDAAKAPAAVATGELDRGMNRVDRRIRSFLSEHRIPGAAVAVTDHGRLVMARGYGYADIAARREVTPTSLFRVASISKPITAVAVLQLVEQGKLKLEDRVFDLLQYEPHLEKDAQLDERYDTITVEQLLEHRGGWDRDVSFDAMFQSLRFARALGVPPPAQQEHVICCMLGVPLDFNPGERYAYSNFGYCLLGRLIEAVSKQSYEEYVKEHVLAPLGIESARLGKTRFHGEPPNGEVRYYSPEIATSVFADSLNAMVPSAYGGWNLEAMDSHGGWTMSAVDLARFACAFDKPEQCKVLNENSLARMFARPAGLEKYGMSSDPQAYYSLGWFNRPVEGQERPDSWHTGSLPGTATLLVRRHDGRNYAILFNARSSPTASHLGQSIRGVLDAALDNVDEWPEGDLFGEF
jgi:N-acyl-D-amino-acid deacylase